MEPTKEKLYQIIKAYLALFLASMLIIYIVFGFVAWGWRMSNWHWSIRLIQIGCSIYLAHFYHELFITFFSEDSDDDNFFYEASKYNND